MNLIVLMTDFGDRDGYPGIMKGVIWSLAPQAQIADLTHQIGPQDITAGAMTLGRAWSYYPAGTVFVGVVDPGVGTRRRPLAGRIGERFFVGPDNGLASLPLQAAAAGQLEIEWVVLDRPEFWLPHPSSSFHGRDIFAPVAAHLVNGVSLAELGTPIPDPVRLALPQPRATAAGWLAPIIHVDHFGNLATGLGRDQLGDREVTLRIGTTELPLVQTFGERPPGSLIAMIDSSGCLAVCVVNGSAAQHLQARVGDIIEVQYKKAPSKPG